MTARDVTDETLHTMHVYGGSFVKQLATLFRMGDPVNQQKLVDAFPAYFHDYAALVEQRAQRDER